jgi:hypothetical protein
LTEVVRSRREKFYKRLSLLSGSMRYPLTNPKRLLIKSRRTKRSGFGSSKWGRYIFAKLMLQEAL